ncbi:acyltransferase 3 [Liberibacter crescens BT-1]|uniref:Acyltransferase 3 n=1 Tax=Liberibacter crescens (strain BT-1) TaxID=1215343 RepID=L0EWY6_LIBCB|nr:acyltransferase [Liberibacter crescens]AGA64891.1 acyltransferase 3 [Liberibacter crescens BT-1]AMC12924.1 hypothetical protein RL73_04540 [Liberibacter crescens]
MKNRSFNNNFDFVRLVAAFIVLISHQFQVFGFSQSLPFIDEQLGRLGVIIFFSVSGFLIAQSWENDQSCIRFIIKRILRIWPALTFMIFATAFLMGPLLTDYTLKKYFTDIDFLKYFLNLVLNIHNTLPGVFYRNAYPKFINASLWTIPPEFKCYILVAILGVLGILKKRSAIICIFIISLILHIWFPMSLDIFSREQWLFFQFAYGFSLFHTKDIFFSRKFYFLFFMALLLILLYLKFGYIGIMPDLALPLIFILIGNQKTFILSSIGKKIGDLSYGIYIYGFPIQQAMYYIYGHYFPFFWCWLLSSIIIVFVSFLSYRYIEKPILKFKPSKN